MVFNKCPCCNINLINPNDIVCFSCAKKTEGKMLISNSRKEELLNLLESYGFEGFLHTTDFNNFTSIFKSGKLMSRIDLINKKIGFIDNAETEIIEKTSQIYKMYTRFYYRPKTPTNYAAYKYHNQKNPVIMVFNKNLIYFNDIIFADGGVAAKRTKITRDPAVAKDFDWKQIFRDDPFTLEEQEMNAFGVGPKNSRNAEFLCGKSVEIDKITKVYFKNMKDFNLAIQTFGKDERFIYMPNKFYGG